MRAASLNLRSVFYNVSNKDGNLEKPYIDLSCYLKHISDSLTIKVKSFVVNEDVFFVYPGNHPFLLYPYEGIAKHGSFLLNYLILDVCPIVAVFPRAVL